MTVLKVVRCQHCERDIEELPSGIWVDLDGFTVCKKRAGDEPFLLHQPLPAIHDPGTVTA